MFKVVLIANDDHPIAGWVSRKFAEAGINYVYHQCYTRKDLEKYAPDADVLWLMSSRKGLVVEENMDIFKKAGAVIKCGSGTDNIDHSACTQRGIIVAHTPEDATDPTSDHTIAMLFTAVRQTARQDRLVRKGVWDPRAALPLGHFSGAELGIIGFGRIARTTVRKLAGFEMDIRVCDPYVDTADIKEAGCRKCDLKELLRKSRFVIISCPLAKETKGMIREKELRMMRPDAVLINCARAGIIEEKALVRALKKGWIKAAAFDVLENHPLKPDDELLFLENLNLTPHTGGYTDCYPGGLFKTVVDVIIDMSKMRLPRWIVNKDVKPRWKMNQTK